MKKSRVILKVWDMTSREWLSTRLGDVTTWTSGGTPRKSELSYWNGDIPWISAVSMKSTRLTDSDLKITEAGLKNGSRFADRDSVLLLVRGSELHKRIPIGIAGCPVAFNQDVKAMKAKEGLIPMYLLYWLLANEPLLLSKVEHTGIGAGKLDTNVVKNLPLDLPPITEQRAIAHILGTLDDKIELNRRTNETLEEMVRAIFKSWFVDFDPVRAKAEGRDPGLPKHIADLFPDSFEESELGEIPKGWPLTPLKEILTAKNDQVGDSYAPEYSSTNEGLQLRSERFKKKLSASTSKNKLIRRGDLVFGLSRRVLNFGLMRDAVGCVSPAYKVFAINQSAVVPDFLERTIKMHPNYFYNAISASSREGQSISIEGLGLLKFVRPDHVVQSMFYRATGALRARTKCSQSETLTLAAIRDTLMPRLVSGDLRVPDAERMVGKVMP